MFNSTCENVMEKINIYDAKTPLSRLVTHDSALIESAGGYITLVSTR